MFYKNSQNGKVQSSFFFFFLHGRNHRSSGLSVRPSLRGAHGPRFVNTRRWPSDRPG